MGVATLVILGALIFYLFIVSKQRRKRGEPRLPIIGDFFQPLLDYEESFQPTTKTNSTNTDDLLTPVATIPNDIAEIAITEPKKKLATSPLPSLSLFPEPEPGNQPSPVPSPTPELKREPFLEIETTQEATNDDSDDKKKKKKKKSKKSKEKKKKKSSKSNSKDSRAKHKHWGKHKHTSKKVATASTEFNSSTPPL